MESITNHHEDLIFEAFQESDRAVDLSELNDKIIMRIDRKESIIESLRSFGLKILVVSLSLVSAYLITYIFGFSIFPDHFEGLINNWQIFAAIITLLIFTLFFNDVLLKYLFRYRRSFPRVIKSL